MKQECLHSKSLLSLQLQVQPWRKPLTMGNQNSEMKSQFTAREGIPMSRHFSSDLQPPKFRHHNNEGPLKVSIFSLSASVMVAVGSVYRHYLACFSYSGYVLPYIVQSSSNILVSFE